MRPYWTGTTDQSMPRAAPGVWPMPYHRAIYIVDSEMPGKWLRKPRRQ